MHGLQTHSPHVTFTHRQRRGQNQSAVLCSSVRATCVSQYMPARFTHTFTSRDLYTPSAMWTKPERSAVQFCACYMRQPIHAPAHCTRPDCLWVPGVKRTERRDIHSPSSSVEIKNEWRYAPVPIHTLITCTLATFFTLFD